MLDYALQFFDNYHEVSRFSYIHTDTAHEASGKAVTLLDKDLPKFLEALFERDERIVLFLMGDHGMRYGEWFT
jgi:hypothetical protein